ncbi:fractalkine isoform X1 [Bos javanicus]|uniref:fractalkine isoform X1 n=2 Tax=Bos javanicus TaxID=9906 RepID=UPI002AA757C3|nr:fractalkine isoform X1 [Bos javanicus]
MGLPPLSRPLCLAVLCHLVALLAGQQHGVNKCNLFCNKMTQKIPESRLVGYQRNRESCNDGAVILKTVKGKSFCADPKEEWVQKAMKHLDHKASVSQKSGTFERQTSEGEPRTTLGAREMYRSAASEVNFTGESSSLGAESALGTSPGVAGSMGTRSSSTSKAPDGGTQKIELFNEAAFTTATSWQSSAADQPEAGLWTEGKASEATSTLVPSTQTLPTPVPSTQAPSTQTLPTPVPSTQTLPTPVPSTQAPSTQASSTQTLPTKTLSTQTLPSLVPSTPDPSTQAPTLSYAVLEDSSGPGSLTVGIKVQDSSKNSLGSKEMSPSSAHTDAFLGSATVSSIFEVTVASEGTPSMDALASGSWGPETEELPKAKEPILTTAGPRSLGILMTSVPDSQVATRRQAVGLLAFLGLLFCLGVAMFAYQRLQSCPHKMVGDVVEGICYVPRSCGSNSYVLVPV